MTIPIHPFRHDTEAGPHVCAECVLGEFHAVHDVQPVTDVPERYEVEPTAVDE